VNERVGTARAFRASVCPPTSRVRSTHSKARPARLDSCGGYRWGCPCNGER
jgi:hypothetical protein